MTDAQTRFNAHVPSPEGVMRIAEVRKRFLALAEFITQTCPPCRETSLALTKLEEAAMWANKGVALNSAEVVDNG